MMLFGALQELECFARTFLAQLLRTFEVTTSGVRRGSDRQYEGQVKFGFQFSLTRGIPPILVSDGGQEVVGDLVTERPLVRQPHTGGFKELVECATLVVDEEGEVGNVEKLCGGGNVLVKVLKQERLRVFRHLGCNWTWMRLGYALGRRGVEGR